MKDGHRRLASSPWDQIETATVGNTGPSTTSPIRAANHGFDAREGLTVPGSVNVEAEEGPPREQLSATTGIPALSLELGREAGSMLLDGRTVLSRQVEGSLRQVSDALGLRAPAVNVAVNTLLGPHHYRIVLGGAVRGEGTVFASRLLALGMERYGRRLSGVDCPTFGGSGHACWIEPEMRRMADESGYLTTTPETFVSFHVSEVFRTHAGDFVDLLAVIEAVNDVLRRRPELVDVVVAHDIRRSRFRRILRSMVSAGVPTGDLESVLVALGECHKNGSEHR